MSGPFLPADGAGDSADGRWEPALRADRGSVGTGLWRGALPEKLADAFGEFLGIAQPALPDDQHFPAESAEFAEVAAVSFDVSATFGLPELRVRGGHDTSVSAAVHVPVAAVHEDDLFVTRQDQVRFAGQIFALQSKRP